MSKNELMRELVEELDEKREEADEMGGEERVEKQHDKGKWDVRQRLDYLFDEGSFTEFGKHGQFYKMGNLQEDVRAPGDGVVSGWGEINGQTAVCAAYDFTVLGGTIGDVNERKVARCREFALTNRVPMIWLVDSAGARVHGGGMDPDTLEGVSMFADSGFLFREQVEMSGVVPQIAAMVGPGAAGTAYIPGLADFVPMVEDNSFMALGGPPLVRAATGEDVSEQELGGAEVHNKHSGVADQMYEDDEECLDAIKDYLSYFPPNCEETPAIHDFDGDPEREEGGEIREELLDVLPEKRRRAYDMHDLLEMVVDGGEMFEMKPMFGKQLITAFARIEGRPVGLVANNPMGGMGGALDNDSADKAARFVNLCDSFNIPLCFFQDVPGFIVGSQYEKEGIIRHGAKMLYEVSSATVPKITVIVRKAYGAGYYVMCGKAYEPDLIAAWPTAEISVMGPEGMVEIFSRKMAQNIDDKAELAQRKQQLIEMIEPYIDIYKVAGRAFIDEVIDPRETRNYIARGLELSENKQVERPWRKSGVRPV